MEYGAKPFNEWRGASEDERSFADKPYSAASYCAQYNVPLEDIQQVIGGMSTHGDVVRWIYRDYVSDPHFRQNSWEVRPMDKDA